MSDYDSSLPMKTATAGDIDVFLSDPTIPAQKLKVNANGSVDTNATIPVGSKIIITDGTDDVAVNADGSVNSVVTATALDIRPLTNADVVTVEDGGGSLTVDAVGLDVRALTSADVVSANLRDDTGTAYSLTNPLAVNVVTDQVGAEIVNYNTSAAVAKNAVANHDYSVSAGKTFIGELAWISGSGKLKAEVLVNGLTVFVGFNSTANPNIEIPLAKIMKAAAAQVIRIAITNRDNQAQDVYSTLTGLEV